MAKTVKSKKAKVAKAPKEAKTPKAKKTTKADAGKGGNGRPLNRRDNGSPSDDAMRELFLRHRSAWNGWQAKLAVVEKVETDVKAALKNDGFTVNQMKIADALAGSPKQEAKVRGEVTDRLKVARWVGHPMGAQLDLFEQPDRTPIADSAYDSGKQAAMEHQAASPPHDPSTEAYREWMAGYHDEQARQVKAGIAPFDQDGEHDTDDGEPAAGWGTSKLPAAADAETDF